MITVFANIKIDDLNRLKRFKRSFLSFEKSKITSWVINVRGFYRLDAYDFLKQKLKQKKLYFYNLNSTNGWFFDTRIMFKSIKTKYIFFWNEDWIFLKSIKLLNKIFKDIHENDIDLFHYSHFSKNTNKAYKYLNCSETTNLNFLIFDKNLRKKYYQIVKKKNLENANKYIISSAVIIKKILFKKIIFLNDPPIKRWSKYTPFDFEKAPQDFHFLPLKISVPKKEIFRDMDLERIDSSHYFDGQKYILKNKYKFRYYIKIFAKFFIINLREFVNYTMSNYILKVFKR